MRVGTAGVIDALLGGDKAVIREGCSVGTMERTVSSCIVRGHGESAMRELNGLAECCEVDGWLLWPVAMRCGRWRGKVRLGGCAERAWWLVDSTKARGREAERVAAVDWRSGGDSQVASKTIRRGFRAWWTMWCGERNFAGMRQ